MSYKDLLEQIRSIQSVLDNQPIHANLYQTQRFLPTLIVAMRLADSDSNDLADMSNWNQADIARKEHGSENWYHILAFARLMSESSYVHQQSSNSSQEQHAGCPICTELLNVVERYIQKHLFDLLSREGLPCITHHWRNSVKKSD
ncbi:hypothetical protein DFH28DRAFT_933017 [Melampsora americana]|nr:hypothetical protein DFH28DRAFT_933017 [Melampsora americana]